MRALIFLLLGLIIFSCRNSGEKEQQKESTTPAPEPLGSTTKYTSQKWHFSAEIPQGFETYEGQLPGESPVINFYDSSIEQEPPLGIHNDASMAYMAILPKGFGVDGPGGPRKTLEEWKGELPLAFDIDNENSFAYLLENGEPWAISLSFHSPPQGWNQYGGIYIFYQVDDFRAECFSSNTGEEISMDLCNPMEGDAMKFYGNVSDEKRGALNSILESLYFTTPNGEREEIGNLINVEQPTPNATVNSPLAIRGEARGYWFFEGSAPVTLITEGGKEIGQSYVEAQGDWMTQDWVKFKASIEFETKEKRGHLIFSRANASGKPEQDRSLRIPVNFN